MHVRKMLLRLPKHVRMGQWRCLLEVCIIWSVHFRIHIWECYSPSSRYSRRRRLEWSLTSPETPCRRRGWRWSRGCLSWPGSSDRIPLQYWVIISHIQWGPSIYHIIHINIIEALQCSPIALPHTFRKFRTGIYTCFKSNWKHLLCIYIQCTYLLCIYNVWLLAGRMLSLTGWSPDCLSLRRKRPFRGTLWYRNWETVTPPVFLQVPLILLLWALEETFSVKNHYAIKVHFLVQFFPSSSLIHSATSEYGTPSGHRNESLIQRCPHYVLIRGRT